MPKAIHVAMNDGDWNCVTKIGRLLKTSSNCPKNKTDKIICSIM